MSINAVAWGEKLETGDSIVYRMQASLKGKREINQFVKELNDWQRCGEGYDPGKKRTIILMMRKFEDKKSWVKFAKTLSFTIEEMSKTGKKRIINGKRKRS